MRAVRMFPIMLCMSTGTRNPEIVKLMAEIDRYREAHEMAATAFGKWAVGDPNLIRDLENGRDLRWPTIKTIRDKMAGEAAA